MNTESSVLTQVAVSLIPRLNSNFCLPLIEQCGGIEGFFRESEHALQQIYRQFNISPDLFDRKSALQGAEKELELIDKYDIRICSMENADYPELLKQCEDVPLILYYKGDLKTSDATKYLAIVGTRHASVRYQERVERIISELCQMGHRPTIVSGLAYGIDASAHRASLKHQLQTFAILGHGLHMIYPASHKTLAESIIDAGGALVSEFPCTSTTLPRNFLQRNRIIAGLCHATLVAESAAKGGAMSTARAALSYNRDVMAFPGRPDDKYSAGCNQLIKENVAALVENGTDIARILNYPSSESKPVQTTLDLFGTGENGSLIISLLEKNGDTHIDELSKLSQIPPSELAGLLLQLELEGKILALPGKRYACV